MGWHSEKMIDPDTTQLVLAGGALFLVALLAVASYLERDKED